MVFRGCNEMENGTWRSLVSVLDWGSRGRRFKSSRPDHFKGLTVLCRGLFFVLCQLCADFGFYFPPARKAETTCHIKENKTTRTPNIKSRLLIFSRRSFSPRSLESISGIV